MTPEKVMETLRTYRENLGRCEHLKVEIEQAETALQELQMSLYVDIASPNTQNLDGMPHGNKVSSPTENIGIMLAAGETPRHIADLKADIRAMQEEQHSRQTCVAYVDAWLKGLTDRERWIVQGQIIDAKTWRELIREHETLYGEPRTKEALKRLRAKSFEKICKMVK